MDSFLRKSYQGRRQDEGQSEGLTRQAERWCMAIVISLVQKIAYDLKITYLSSFEILNHLKLKNPEKQIKLLILKGLTRR
jgi:hypothetical protein